MGKASLIMVVGLSIVLALVGVNLSSRSSSAISNAENYYMDAALFSMKTSGVNMAVGKVFRDTAYVEDITIGSWNSYYTGEVKIKERGYGSLEKVGDLYVKIGRPFRDSLIVISYAIGKAYDARGRVINDTDSTIVGMRRTNFAEYAYFTDNEKTPSGSNIYWISGDSAGINVLDTMNGGKVHTNDVMRIDGSPVFFGKVTTELGKTLQSGSNPVFKGGYESGVHIDMPGDYNLIAANKAGGWYRNNVPDIYLTFYSNGRMGYKYTSGGSDSATVDLLSPTFNGLVVITNSNIHMKGTVNGYVTVAALQGTGGTSKGNVWIDDDVKYNVDPRVNPFAADDYLGIVADNNVWITDNDPNNTNGIDIQASIMARKGSFGAQNYADRHVPGGGHVSGQCRLLGGVIQDTRGPLGTHDGDVKTSGFWRVYSYDGRMATTYPPFFPMTKQFKIYTWWE
jgi:hypothetical protein